MAMQSLALTRELLTELDRCDRSFIMSLYWHNLASDVLLDKQHGDADPNDVAATRQGIMMDLSNVQLAIQAAGGVSVVQCPTGDIWEKVRNTQAYLASGGPLVIVDGALAGSSCVVGFALLIVREDGMWEVYHLSNKSYVMQKAVDVNTALTSTMSDAAPLMYVLAENYSNLVAKFGVIAANKRYMTPYPDPVTGLITVSPDEAMHQIDLTNEFGNIGRYLPADNPLARANMLQEQIARDPFWIPPASMGVQCNKPYTCPFKTYCAAREDPDSVTFHMSSNDAKKLKDNGYPTMKDVVELSYQYPTLQDVPSRYYDKLFSISEVGLREVRAYEMNMY